MSKKTLSEADRKLRFECHRCANFDIGNTSWALRDVFRMRMDSIKLDLLKGDLTKEQAMGLYVNALDECSHAHNDKQMEKMLKKAGLERVDFDASTGKLV